MSAPNVPPHDPDKLEQEPGTGFATLEGVQALYREILESTLTEDPIPTIMRTIQETAHDFAQTMRSRNAAHHIARCVLPREVHHSVLSRITNRWMTRGTPVWVLNDGGSVGTDMTGVPMLSSYQYDRQRGDFVLRPYSYKHRYANVLAAPGVLHRGRESDPGVMWPVIAIQATGELTVIDSDCLIRPGTNGPTKFFSASPNPHVDPGDIMRLPTQLDPITIISNFVKGTLVTANTVRQNASDYQLFDPSTTNYEPMELRWDRNAGEYLAVG